jgi:hypothetical protein
LAPDYQFGLNRRKGTIMSLQDRIETLRTKHADLEIALRHEIARPLPDEQSLTDLKRQKLHIKDMIAELTRQPELAQNDLPGGLQ